MTPHLGGLWIVLEGIDGAGKTTMADEVERVYKEAGRTVVRVREPGGTPLGERLRSVFLQCKEDDTSTMIADVLMLVAAKHVLYNQVVWPAIQRGDVVIADRWSDTLYAYQGGGFGVEKHTIDGILMASQMSVMPDLSIYLDISPVQAAARLKHNRRAADQNRLDRMGIPFYKRVRSVYKERVAKSATSFTVDADRPFKNVAKSVVRVLKENNAL